MKVLTEALTRDEVARLRRKSVAARKGEVRQKIKAFIQNVHHFRDEGLNHPGAPSDHVVIFDEAQRTWDHAMTRDFMRRKKGRPDFVQSEPEFLLSYLDRHSGWAAVICLVGGGQEINRGEAGISAWLDALLSSFNHWTAYISPNLRDSEYDAERSLDHIADVVKTVKEPSLHLAVSMRSFRAENVSRFVKAVLDIDSAAARRILTSTLPKYPIAITRDLERAKGWVRSMSRGSERFGLVASSGAQRLKPHAVDIRMDQLLPRGRGDRVSGSRARTRLGVRDVGCRSQVRQVGLELPLIRRQQVAERQEARSPSLPPQRVPRTADTGAPGNGGLCS